MMCRIAKGKIVCKTEVKLSFNLRMPLRKCTNYRKLLILTDIARN